MKIDREGIIQKLSDTEYDTIEVFEIRDILENGETYRQGLGKSLLNVDFARLGIRDLGKKVMKMI